VDIVKVRQSVSVGPPTEEHWFYVMRATHRRRQTGRRCDPDAPRATERSEGASPTERSEGGSVPTGTASSPVYLPAAGSRSPAGWSARERWPNTVRKTQKIREFVLGEGGGGPPSGAGRGVGARAMARWQVVGSLLAGCKLPDGRQWGAGAPGNGGQWGRSSRGVALSAWPRRLDLISCASGVHPDRDGGRVRTACGISARDGRLSHRM